MTVYAVNFSHAKNSMGMRGIWCLDMEFDNIINLADYNIPVCYSNNADGVVPNVIEHIFEGMKGADQYVFVVSEAAGDYPAGFKNLMDWFVVKTQFNSSLGTTYPFSNKPVALVTFTPSLEVGHRHHEKTGALIEKLGGTLSGTYTFRDGWATVVPGNKLDATDIINDLNSTVVEVKEEQPNPNTQRWVTGYREWDQKWEDLMRFHYKQDSDDTVPWPRIGNAFEYSEKNEEGKFEIPLKQEYSLGSMDYLDHPNALPIFKTQAEQIILNECKGIVDVGCRWGPTNSILKDAGYTDYDYYGFDTSSEPIQYGTSLHTDNPRIEYEIRSWDELREVDFNVDCIIFSGVLLYEPDGHRDLFDRIVRFYKPKMAIIQEPCFEQDDDKWEKDLHLNTIERELDSYIADYPNHEDVTVNCDIFSGRRRIVTLHLN